MFDRIGWGCRVVLYGMTRGYQKWVSPRLFPACRFTPSCSNYALEVLETWPLWRGLGLILWRLARCQPFGRPGFDAVPKYPGHPGHLILRWGELRGRAPRRRKDA